MIKLRDFVNEAKLKWKKISQTEWKATKGQYDFHINQGTRKFSIDVFNNKMRGEGDELAYEGGSGSMYDTLIDAQKVAESWKPGKSLKSEGRRGAYHDFRDDEELNTRQKIGHSLRSVRDQLAEVEKLVDMNVRLKQETGINSQEYWKRTHRAMNRIGEKMGRISEKMNQFIDEEDLNEDMTESTYGTSHLKKQKARLGTLLKSMDDLIDGERYCIVDLGLGEWNSGYEYVGYKNGKHSFIDKLTPRESNDLSLTDKELKDSIKNKLIAFEN